MRAGTLAEPIGHMQVAKQFVLARQIKRVTDRSRQHVNGDRRLLRADGRAAVGHASETVDILQQVLPVVEPIGVNV